MTTRAKKVSSVGAARYLVRETLEETTANAEPPGRWTGRGASRLRLGGSVTRVALGRLLDGNDPHTGERLGTAYRARSVRGIELVVSCPKSISVLHGVANDATRSVIEGCVDRTVDATVEFVESVVVSMIGRGVERRREPVLGLTAASFLHFTSRALDPHLHAHVVLANRVQTADTRWRAIDADWLLGDPLTLSAVADALLRSELTAALGITWRPAYHGRYESRDVPVAVIDAFSTRTAHLRAATRQLVDQHVERTGFRPAPRDQWKLVGHAIDDTRPTKSSYELSERRTTWRRELVELGHAPDALVAGAVHAASRSTSASVELDRSAVLDTAMATVSPSPMWRVMELHRAVANAVPTTTALEARRLLREIDEMAADALSTRCVELTPIPPGVDLRPDGRPVNERAMGRWVSTETRLSMEREVLVWAQRRTEIERGSRVVSSFDGRVLGPLEHDAASAIAGDDDLVLVRAGAGPSTTRLVAAALAQLHRDGRPGLAVSTTGAVGMSGLGPNRWVTSFDALLHDVVADPRAIASMTPGATLVVAGAEMVTLDQLTDVSRVADQRGWRVALLGASNDGPRLAADSMFALLAETHAVSEVSPCGPAQGHWEREAVHLLRGGDPRAAALYDEHGVLRGGTDDAMFAAATGQWWSNRQHYERTHLLCVDVDSVRRGNRRCQELRAAAGDVDLRGRRVEVARGRVHPHDDIVTRSTSARLLTSSHRAVRRGVVWRVDDVGADGSLAVSGRDGSLVLPPDYVAEHVDLGYARLVDEVRGRSAKRAVLFLPAATDLPSLYRGMTRANVETLAFVAVRGVERPVDVLHQSLRTASIARRRRPVHADLASPPHRPGGIDADRLRPAIERQHERTRSLTAARHLVGQAPQRRADVASDLHICRTELTDHHDRSHDMQRHHHTDVSRRTRRERHAAEIARAAEYAALMDRIDELQQELAELEAEDAQIDRDVARAQAVLAASSWEMSDREDRLVADCELRVQIVRNDTPAWVIDTVGERPHDPTGAAAWDAAVGHLDQQRHAWGDLDDGWTYRPGDDSARAFGYRTSLDLVRRVRDLARDRDRGLDLGR